ncbi:50S ribosomal protein L28 [Lentzea sp. NPDC060358]|uniref:50S ribosomal protein L28 n=1 Tax=Lentzea sp. NPDC060358 TaxID=3347103 RepID=UPI00365482F6
MWGTVDENECRFNLEVPVRCQLTGREPGFGNRVSHSHRKTRRRWNPNVQRKRYWVPSLNRFVTLTLSAKGIKTVDKLGVEAVVARLRAQGEKV